jgi:putative glycosyltransferase (TIGR04348 family)
MGYDGRRFDALIVLHARRGAEAARSFCAAFPDRPLIVALTGTDLYGDLPRGDAAARRSVELADRLVVLQCAALDALAPPLRAKAAVIYQSVAPIARPAHRRRSPRFFEVAVVGGLRRVKDPLRAAYAARLLPADSRIRVTCVGPAIEPSYAERAVHEARRNPRFRWIGSVSYRRARAIVARSDLVALTSRSEGGANVIAEALVEGTPVISSRIDGSIGMLGANYPGYFPAGDTRALAALLSRVERDERFRTALTRAGAALAPRFSPAAERTAWERLLAGLQAP